MGFVPHLLILSISFTLLYMATYAISFLGPLVLYQLKYGGFGFVVLGFNYLAFGLSYFSSQIIISKYGARKMLPMGAACNILYAASYIIPVSCSEQQSITGLCSYGFSGTLIFITALAGGFGLALLRAAKEAYIAECSVEANIKKNKEGFALLVLLHTILGSLFAVPLLSTSKLRIALYILLMLLAINSLVFQMFLPQSIAENTVARAPDDEAVIKPVFGKIKESIKTLLLAENRDVFLSAIYSGLATAYYISVLPFLAGESYLKDGSDHTSAECDQKAAVTMIGFGVGKCISLFLLQKLAQAPDKKIFRHLTFLICAVAIVFAMVVLHAEKDKYRAGWFFVALFMGCQDAFLEHNRNLTDNEKDSAQLASGRHHMIAFSSFICFIIATGLSRVTPIYLLSILVITLIISYIFSLKPPTAKTTEDEAGKEKMLLAPGTGESEGTKKAESAEPSKVEEKKVEPAAATIAQPEFMLKGDSNILIP